MSESLKCECPHCGQPIELPADQSWVACPSCTKNFKPGWTREELARYEATEQAWKTGFLAPQPIQEPLPHGKFENEERAGELSAGAAETEAAKQARLLRDRVRQIREHAENLRIRAMGCAVIAGLSLLFALGSMVNEGGISWATGLFSIAGGLGMLSIWLYLISQIVHIRANTEK